MNDKKTDNDQNTMVFDNIKTNPLPSNDKADAMYLGSPGVGRTKMSEDMPVNVPEMTRKIEVAWAELSAKQDPLKGGGLILPPDLLPAQEAEPAQEAKPANEISTY